MKNYCLTVQIKFVEEPFCVSKEFWYRKFSNKGGGNFHGFVENFLYHRTEKTSPGNHSVFQKISVGEKYFTDKREGVSRFSVEKFLSDCTKILHWRTLWCFGKIFLSKIFMLRRGGGITVLSKIFYLTGPKKLRQGTILCFRKFLVWKNILWIRERGVSRFSIEKFLSDCTKILHWRTLGVSEKFSFRKFSCLGGGGASQFCRNFLFHRTETKSFVKEPFCFPENFWYRKKFIRGGISRFSLKIFMSHSAENFGKGILLFLRKFLVSKSLMDEKGGHPFNVSENLGYRKILCIIGGITFFRRKFLVSQC